MMWGLAGAQLFGVLVTIAITAGLTIQKIVEQWATVLRAQEKTKRVEMKTAAKRAEAEARTVAAWTPPVSTVMRTTTREDPIRHLSSSM